MPTNFVGWKQNLRPYSIVLEIALVEGTRAPIWLYTYVDSSLIYLRRVSSL
jgi:hypothetical protein